MKKQEMNRSGIFIHLKMCVLRNTEFAALGLPNRRKQTIMKKFKNLLGILILFSLTMVSCKREFDEIKPATQITAKTVKEIKAPNTFNWNTSNRVSFSFKSVAGDVRKGTIKIMTENRQVLFQRLQKVSDSYTGMLELPANTKTVLVSFNGATSSLDVSKGNFEISVK